MSGNIILYVFAAVAVILGVLVFLRNDQSRQHRWFLGLSLSIASWMVSNALFAQAATDALAYGLALIAYACAATTATTFLFFVAELCGVHVHGGRAIKAVATLFILSSLVPNFLATGVVEQEITTTPFILLYAVGLAALFVGGIGILLYSRKHSRGQRRQQIGAVMAGLIGGILGGLFFNLILPINGDYRFVQLGPAFSILFVVAAAYAIIKHRLFDLRAAILRVAAYFLALLAVASIYVVAAYVVIGPLLGDVVGEWLYIILAVLTAVTFQPIKQFFDRATRAVFYKNAYETQHVLDQLGTLMVREVDVSRLLKKSMQLLSDAVKPSAIEVVLLKDHQQARVVALGRALKRTDELIQGVRTKRTGFTITDDLAEHGGLLHRELAAAGVAIITPLVTSNATVGYLLIGYKSSGDAFTQQDVDLVHIFGDELAVAVQNALRFEEISRFNVTLKEEVDDATSQLRDSNRKLHKLDEAKDEFISMASHQLRTPLTSVKGYLSMVLEGDAGKISEDQKKLLEEAYSSAQRMVYLIGDFLNVSRLQTGKFMLEAVPVNLAALVAEEVDQLQATAARRQVTLQYHAPSQFPEAIMDDGKMRQVVMNFIDNAVYYSRPNSSVVIEVTATGRDVSFAVHDTGIGVPSSERHHLFTKFFRASNARKVRPDGTGIGLYMAKKVITAHKGSIIFETKENKGSTFGFKLPLKH
jgi:signal transduction histidine kinase